jgi:aldehyde dehydrogenase (NAD+)
MELSYCDSCVEDRPALIYGNTVVFKPSEEAPLTALMLVKVLVEAGLPPGVINFLTGDGTLIGREMTSSPDINGISFTGSYDVGTKIYQTRSRTWRAYNWKWAVKMRS